MDIDPELNKYLPLVKYGLDVIARTTMLIVISWKFLIKYYEYSFNYLIIIMNQLRLTCYLVYSTVCFLTGHRLTELTK